MTKIILTAAAVLALSGSAFAGSDHFNPNVSPSGAVIDTTHTASVPNTGSPVYKLLNASGSEKPAVPGSDRNLFGNT